MNRLTLACDGDAMPRGEEAYEAIRFKMVPANRIRLDGLSRTLRLLADGNGAMRRATREAS